MSSPLGISLTSIHGKGKISFFPMDVDDSGKTASYQEKDYFQFSRLSPDELDDNNSQVSSDDSQPNKSSSDGDELSSVIFPFQKTPPDAKGIETSSSLESSLGGSAASQPIFIERKRSLSRTEETVLDLLKIDSQLKPEDLFDKVYQQQVASIKRQNKVPSNLYNKVLPSLQGDENKIISSYRNIIGKIDDLKSFKKLNEEIINGIKSELNSFFNLYSTSNRSPYIIKIGNAVTKQIKSLIDLMNSHFWTQDDFEIFYMEESVEESNIRVNFISDIKNICAENKVRL
jgi:hypothetical protein